MDVLVAVRENVRTAAGRKHERNIALHQLVDERESGLSAETHVDHGRIDVLLQLGLLQRKVERPQWPYDLCSPVCELIAQSECLQVIVFNDQDASVV